MNWTACRSNSSSTKLPTQSKLSSCPAWQSQIRFPNGKHRPSHSNYIVLSDWIFTLPKWAPLCSSLQVRLLTEGSETCVVHCVGMEADEGTLNPRWWVESLETHLVRSKASTRKSSSQDICSMSSHIAALVVEESLLQTQLKEALPK